MTTYNKLANVSNRTKIINIILTLSSGSVLINIIYIFDINARLEHPKYKGDFNNFIVFFCMKPTVNRAHVDILSKYIFLSSLNIEKAPRRIALLRTSPSVLMWNNS